MTDSPSRDTRQKPELIEERSGASAAGTVTFHGTVSSQQSTGHHPHPTPATQRDGVAVCLQCTSFFSPTASGQTICSTCSSWSSPALAQQTERQGLILCPGCRGILVRPRAPHAIAMCGQCQTMLKLPEHVDEHHTHHAPGYGERFESSAYGITAARSHGMRAPPGFVPHPMTTPPIQNVVACICPGCSAVVQAPLSAPICKCGNCGQFMTVPSQM